MLTGVKNIHSDEELMKLVYKWQNQPNEYTNLLIEQIYPTLRRLCQFHTGIPNNTKNIVTATATSLVSDVYLKLNNGLRKSDVESLRLFYKHLRDVIRAVLIDRYRKASAKKRNNHHRKNLPLTSIIINGEEFYITDDIFLEFTSGLSKLKEIEPNAHEALSIKLYNAKTNKEIALIMNKSVASIERYIQEGNKLLNAIIQGVDVDVLVTI